jgi:HAD superfamily phosphoserine phosphatase-like hydrolase
VPPSSKIFLSYAKEDREHAIRVHDALTACGLNVWLDTNDLRPGQRWKPAIREAIRSSQYFVALLSPRSVAKRGFVQNEVRQALEIVESHPDSGIFVIPARVSECEPDHALLQELHWVDLFPEFDVGIRKIVDTIAPSKESPSSGYKLVCFDLDGTLIRGRRFDFSWKRVWDFLKLSGALRRRWLKDYYKHKRITYAEWCGLVGDEFKKKKLHRDQFRDIVRHLRMTKNLESTIETLRSAGIKTAIVSGGISTFLDELMPNADKLFDYIELNRFQFDDDGYFKEIVPTTYDFAGKAQFMFDRCEELGIGIDQCVFVGEGFNDEDAVKAAGLSIAYPPTQTRIAMHSDVDLEKDDLSMILEHIVG